MVGEPSELAGVLKNTAFKTDQPVTNAQMAALLVVANQYKLNPWTKELYAFPDKKSGIIPVVGVDGWSRIINSNNKFDGMEFIYSDEMTQPEGAFSKAHEWVECVIHRKDRKHPTIVREYLDEVYRKPFKGNNGKVFNGPWQTHPKRFQRHKAMIQCARLAFGFVGIFDQDEAERIVEAQDVEIIDNQAATPKAGAFDRIDNELHDYIRTLAGDIKDYIDNDKPRDAVAMIEEQKLDADQYVALWSCVGSKERRIFKETQQLINQELQQLGVE